MQMGFSNQTNYPELVMTDRNSTIQDIDKQPIIRSANGVGYNSGGKHKVRIDNKDVLSYIVWRNMLRRCYSKDNRPKDKTYKDCVVSPEFHDYQDFAEWYTNHDYYGLGYCLDKDILVKNNKVYSPSRCCLVPMEINNLFIDRRGDRGGLPIGVTYHPQSGKFISRLSTSNGRIYLGLFQTAGEAYQAYKLAKEDYVKQVVSEWRGRIDENIYIKLMNWKA